MRPRILVVSRAAARFEHSKGGADVLAIRHAVFLSREFGEVAYAGVHRISDPEGITYLPVPDTDLVAYERRGSTGASFGFLLNHLVRAAKAAFVAHRSYRTFRPDVVIAHTSVAILILKTLDPRRSLVYHIHDGLFVHRTLQQRTARVVRFLTNDLLERLAVRQAEQVLCVSQSICLQLREAGIPEQKLSVVPLIRSRLDCRSEGSRDGPSPLPRLPAGPFILSVGQQTGRKRFDLLIEAMPFTRSAGHLVIVGDGPLHRHYEALVDRLGLEDRVHLLQDVSDTELLALYDRASAFLLVSENEGFPVTVGEAIAHGCPVVLLCPNIETTGEYPIGLVRLLKEVPPPREMAHLVDHAVSSHPERSSGEVRATASTPRTHEEPEDFTQIRAVYASVFQRLRGIETPLDAGL